MAHSGGRVEVKLAELLLAYKKEAFAPILDFAAFPMLGMVLH